MPPSRGVPVRLVVHVGSVPVGFWGMIHWIFYQCQVTTLIDQVDDLDTSCFLSLDELCFLYLKTSLAETSNLLNIAVSV